MQALFSQFPKKIGPRSEARFSLGKMDVIVDVILAEAVVSRAARAVTELQLRIIRIRAAADRALVVIELLRLLVADAPRLAPEIDRVFCRPVPAYHVPELSAAEDQEVQHGDDRQQLVREGIGDDAVGKKSRVQPGQIFDLERDDKKQQHLQVGKEHREGKEHRQVHVGRRQVHVDAEDQVHEDAAEHRQDCAGEEIDRELAGTPVLLQRGADPVIEINRDEAEPAHILRNEEESHQAPDLTVQHALGRKAEIADQERVDQAQQPIGGAADGDVAHQIGNPEAGVLITKAFHVAHRVFHGHASFP